MIKTKVTYLNKKFVVEEEEPSTIPELIQLVGEEGVVVNTNANLRYRNKYPRVYIRVSMELVKLGHPLGEDQDEMNHIRSFLTSKSENEKILSELFNRIAKEEPLYIRGDRVGGSGRIAQGAMDAAHRYFAEGMEKVIEVAETVENMLPGYRIARDHQGNLTPEALARGIQTLQRHLQSKAKMVVKNL